MALLQAFGTNVGHRLEEGRVVVGRFDGRAASIACATTGGKVLVHRTSAGATDDGDSSSHVSFLNINRSITALATGPVASDVGPRGVPSDVLVVATESGVLVYDVDENVDILNKDVSEGIFSLAVGRLGTTSVMPLIVTGGNCAVQGFTADGEDVFFSVAGDNVTALALVDISGDGVKALVVGSEDYEIRFYRNDVIVTEITESDCVTALCDLGGGCFGFALANGTVGVYRGEDRLWVHKENKRPTSICGFRMEDTDAVCLAVGWVDGAVEVRDRTNGRSLFSDNLPYAVAGVVALPADPQPGGAGAQLVACAVDGEMRGYAHGVAGAGAASSALAAARRPDRMIQVGESSVTKDEYIQGLHTEKQALNRELALYKASNAKVKAKAGPDAGFVPVNTRLTTDLAVDDNGLVLNVVTNNDTVIRAVTVFAEGVFEGESVVAHPFEARRELAVTLQPIKHVRVPMRVQAVVGYPAADECHVFEEEVVLPRFAAFVPMTRVGNEWAYHGEVAVEPAAGVVFTCTAQPSRIKIWMQNAFLLGKTKISSSKVELGVVSLTTGEPVILRYLHKSDEFHIRTLSMALAGDLLQDLAADLKIDELDSMADFPEAMEAFHTTLELVDAFDTTRKRFTADLADTSLAIKQIVVKAENARVVGDFAAVRSLYATLHALNQEQFAEFARRETNQRELMACLKVVNQTILQASRLRVGQPQTRVVKQCRAALKGRRFEELIQVMMLSGADA